MTIKPDKDCPTLSGVVPLSTEMKIIVKGFSGQLDELIASTIDKKVSVEGGININMALLNAQLEKLKGELI